MDRDPAIVKASGLLLAALVLVACERSTDPAPRPEAGAASREAGGAGSPALELCACLEPGLELGSLEVELERLARAVRSRARSGAGVEQVAGALLTVLGTEGEDTRVFGYEAGQRRLDRVLVGGRGNCVALASLYLAVGSRAGLDLRPLLAPGHVYVRLHVGGRSLDLETTGSCAVAAGDLAREHFFFDEAQRERHDVELGEREWRSFLTAEHVYDLLGTPGSQKLADELLAEALELWPENRSALRLRALRHLWADRPGAALADLERLADLDPSDADTLVSLGEALHDLGRTEEAREVLARALAIDGRSPHAHLLAAWIALAEGDPSAALAAATRAQQVPMSQLHPVRRRMLEGYWPDPGGLLLRLHELRAGAHGALAGGGEVPVADGDPSAEHARLARQLEHLRACWLHGLAVLHLRGQAEEARELLGREPPGDGARSAALVELEREVRGLLAER